ncbi:S9 family peptidase [Roseateles violae]|uniref:Prolyl oligopeptidase family serine peptidase n=1 Tax=Roseateles violae TaxID=3058042 RepID=A0ABT8E059_9BURK|nr:prolyl oligopeptidase family serine peptidase [Pelomonas sp. PFR6]MDN3923195.1 prolyl oligopeptidase family serine peptidase [Pelomonas sp. PFR6]
MERSLDWEELEQRYRAAASMAPGRREPLRHGPVTPHWSADGRYFWYERTTALGREHLLVDVQARASSALFDPAALAAALTSILDRQIALSDLQPTRLEFDAQGDLLRFEYAGGRWRWLRGSGQLRREGDAFTPDELASPDGRWAVALKGPNLLLRAADEPAAQGLTTDGVAGYGWGDFVDYTTQASRQAFGPPLKPHALWSPDGRRLAIVRIDRRKVGLMHLVQSVPAEGSRPALYSYPFPMAHDGDEQRERAEVWFVSLDGARVRAQIDVLQTFAHRAFIEGQGRWSADGRHFYIVDNDRLHTSISLWRVDASDGRAERLQFETGPAVVRAAPTLAETPIFHVFSDGRLLWWSQRDGWGHLWLLQPGAPARQLTQGPWQVRELLHVDEATGEVLFTAGGREPGVDPYYRLVYRVDLQGSAPRCLTPEPADHRALEAPHAGNGEPPLRRGLSPCASYFVDVYSTVTQAPISVLRSAATGEILMTLERAEVGHSRPQGLPLPEPFSVPALDGDEEVWGVLYRPLGFDPARSYPVIDLIYAAPQTIAAPHGWDTALYGSLPERLACLGFAVVIIDAPGTPYRSHRFQLAAHGRMEVCGLPDHVNAIRALARKHAWLDEGRVGIAGGSGGGFATVRALADHGDFYRCGAALCGSHDSSAYIPYWGEMFQGAWDAELYARQDNNNIVDRIRGELLLIHGDMDDNCHPSMTLRLVDALIRADRNFDLLLVPNAGHILGSVPYVMRRTQDFFVRHLLGCEPPRPGIPTTS